VSKRDVRLIFNRLMSDHLFIFEFIPDDMDETVLGKNFNEVKIMI